MNKKLLGILSIIIIIAVAVGGFLMFGNEKDTTQAEDDKKKEEFVDKDGELNEFQKDMEEAVGDNKISKEKRIEIARGLLEKNYEIYIANNEEELKQSIKDSYREPTEQLINETINCCLAPGRYKEIQLEFNDETTGQNGETSFEYSAEITLSGFNTETKEEDTITERVIIQVSKADNKFLIDSMKITR